MSSSDLCNKIIKDLFKAINAFYLLALQWFLIILVCLAMTCLSKKMMISFGVSFNPIPTRGAGVGGLCPLQYCLPTRIWKPAYVFSCPTCTKNLEWYLTYTDIYVGNVKLGPTTNKLLSLACGWKHDQKHNVHTTLCTSLHIRRVINSWSEICNQAL